ncbi:MAG: pentapeptide repeat-containing protein [Nitrospiraceae bacterium]
MSQKHVDRLLRSVPEWNSWRQENPRVIPDLTNANLAGANLTNANLAGANIADANIADATLARADLAGATLARAYLAGAYLARADLARANLTDANLAGANLAGADLARADLAGANLTRAYLADVRGIIAAPIADPRGHTAFFWKKRQGSWWVNSGCRSTTIAQARKHWGEYYLSRATADMTSREIGDQYLRAFDWLEKLLAARALND